MLGDGRLGTAATSSAMCHVSHVTLAMVGWARDLRDLPSHHQAVGHGTLGVRGRVTDGTNRNKLIKKLILIRLFILYY